jgi:outer membrane cobalamin receptor
LGVPVNGYTLINLTASYDLGRGVSAFGRIDNLLNRQYQNPLGFDHPGLGIYVGLRLALGPGAATGQKGGTGRE